MLLMLQYTEQEEILHHGTMVMRDTENTILIIIMLDQSMSQPHMLLPHQHTPPLQNLHTDQPHKMNIPHNNL